MTRQLIQLARSYFHQDYDLDSGTPDDVVYAFVREEGPSAADNLRTEIEDLLASTATEDALVDLWMRTLRANYDPAADGWSYRHWFAHVLELLDHA